jgi:hypothetical protein
MLLNYLDLIHYLDLNDMALCDELVDHFFSYMPDKSIDVLNVPF